MAKVVGVTLLESFPVVSQVILVNTADSFFSASDSLYDFGAI